MSVEEPCCKHIDNASPVETTDPSPPEHTINPLYDNLLCAIWYGDVDCVKKLLADTSLYHYTKAHLSGSLLIYMAKDYYGARGMKLLLDNGAKIEGIRGAYDTPLLLSAERGHIDNIIVLLEYGADVDVSSCQVSPLIMAVRNKSYLAVQLLVEGGANIE